ncbi:MULTISPECIES: hypothetical protein [Limnospira]|uniref:Uncharacterized protein n=1 Tax=Limnospira platensis NIES-46 TaxID=1236695 RepID=A0A5M3T0K0_LIMPL|nr:hypothetical protein [Arthrospira platensis]MDF2210969.1 hypothetical protein [Arthrospira platensis NCB002]MDT9182471.1 hypothetical protein [Limnospira sp. PMC 289.06]MDT9297291.1 hypothetical protein [Arthrospira platensis PCC 7345]BAI88990.1 hypothetical protein NIES39_C01200 [Arthrospira platensis NIES-39]BDT11392.1 hypothetical protein N39L_11150 [Arthrospira platensis NIES-39]
MIDLEGRGLEILRWFLAIAAGAIVIPIQSWLFRSGSIALWDVDPTRWVASIFERASLIVWSVSLIGSVIWYMMAVQMRRHFAPKDTKSAMVKWWIVLLLPLLVLIGNIWVFGKASTAAFPWFVGFLLLNMVLTFWLSTAVSTPSPLAHVVPLAFEIRRVLRID